MNKFLLTLGLIGLVKITTAQSLFPAQVTYPTGTEPVSVAVADFDNDGKADIATVNVLDNTISVLLNTGAGIFAAQVTYTVGAHPFGIAAADFNGDNKIDIVITNSQDNNLSVLVNSGSGTFTTQATYTVGTAPEGITTADFNSDNKADIVVANFSDNTISVLLNTGTGTFAAQVTYTVGTSPYGIASGDFNSDGKADIVVTNNNNNNVSVLINAGTGTFSSQTTYSVGAGPEGVAVADFDGDGHSDIVAANFGGKVSVLINTGTGTFNAQVTYTVGTNPLGVATADFNGDGHMDIVATNNTSNNIAVLVNNGVGSFNAAILYATDFHPYNVATADFNGDGKMDIVTNNSASNDISVFNSLIPAAALNFDGVDDNVSIPNNAVLNITNAITIESWIKTTGSPTTEQYIVTKNDDSYYVGLNVGGGANGQVSFYLNGVSSSWLYSNSTTLNDSTWHHVGCTYDGSTMSIYVDGVLDNSTALTGTISTGISNMYLGSRSNNQFFQGSMDEFRIWNRALCAAEIQHNMHGEIANNSNGLVAYYKFNQGSDNVDNTAITTLSDASVNALAGSFTNFALTGSTSNFVAPGAVTTGSMVIAFTNTLSVVASQTNIACNGDASGTASVTASGLAPYTYSWSPGGGTGAAQGSLLSGNYTCTIANGCGTIAQTFTLTEPTRLSVTATASTIACNGGATTVTVSATGGVTLYTGTGTFTATANSYTYTVTDANACAATATITVSQPAALVISQVAQTNATCYGNNSGSATVTVNGGSTPYSYMWSTTPVQTSSVAINLSAGTYSVLVNDANMCATSTTLTITQPNAINVSTTQAGALITANNATATAYQWFDCNFGNAPISGATNQSYSATVNGSYGVIVTVGSCSVASFCVPVTSIGIAQYNAINNLQVYPNPFSNELTIVSATKTNAMLFDMLGNKINEFVLQNTTQTISLSDLAPGMYYLQVDNSKLKIIKQ